MPSAQRTSSEPAGRRAPRVAAPGELIAATRAWAHEGQVLLGRMLRDEDGRGDPGCAQAYGLLRQLRALCAAAERHAQGAARAVPGGPRRTQAGRLLLKAAEVFAELYGLASGARPGDGSLRTARVHGPRV